MLVDLVTGWTIEHSRVVASKVYSDSKQKPVEIDFAVAGLVEKIHCFVETVRLLVIQTSDLDRIVQLIQIDFAVVGLVEKIYRFVETVRLPVTQTSDSDRIVQLIQIEFAVAA